MSRKIAFIDYEPNVLESLKWLFKEEPYQVHIFHNPLEALKMIKEEEFALVIADQHIPEIGGIDLLKRVKELRPNTVCMIMTALLDIDTAGDTVGRKNIYGIIFKPWDNHELKIMVKRAITYYNKNSCADNASNNPQSS